MLDDSLRALETRLRAAPEDAQTWRVYADLLQQLGDVRGELILLEQAAEQHETPELIARIDELVDVHRHSWQPSYTPASGWFEWRHHFVWGLTLSSLANAMTLTNIAQLFDDPQARLLCELRIRIARDAELGDDGVELRDALASLELGRLRLLQVAYHPYGEAVIDALLGCPTLALTTLDLRHAGLDDEQLRRLAACEQLSSVRSLYLQGNAIGTSGALALTRRTPFASKLEHLDLRGNPLGESGAWALATASQLHELRTLHVHVEDIEHGGVRRLASSDRLNRELVRYWRGIEERECP